jgi:YVTN family beta-propeller protein
VFTANIEDDSVSIINLENSNTVTNIDLGFGSGPSSVTFDEQGRECLQPI